MNKCVNRFRFAGPRGDLKKLLETYTWSDGTPEVPVHVRGTSIFPAYHLVYGDTPDYYFWPATDRNQNEGKPNLCGSVLTSRYLTAHDAHDLLGRISAAFPQVFCELEWWSESGYYGYDSWAGGKNIYRFVGHDEDEKYDDTDQGELGSTLSLLSESLIPAPAPGGGKDKEWLNHDDF